MKRIKLILIIAFFAESLFGQDPFLMDQPHRFELSSSAHWLGTDEYGRDMLARIVYAGQVSILIALIAIFVSILLGFIFGAFAAVKSGNVERVFSKIIDALITLPSFLFILIIAKFFKSNYFYLGIAIGLISWFGLSKLIWEKVHEIKNQDYVRYSQLIGRSDIVILFSHILPNLVLILKLSFLNIFVYSILMESSLSVLGFGVQQPSASLGNMLNNAQNYLHQAPQLVILSGIVLIIIVISVQELLNVFLEEKE